jgi:hypothetical protein
MGTGCNTPQSGTQLLDAAICGLVIKHHELVPNCWMQQCVDWSQHATNWYPTVRYGNMWTGHNTPHNGTQLLDAATCRLVTTRHTMVPNCQMLQYADWSQHATHWYPTVGCSNMYVDWSQHANTSVPYHLFLVLHFHST